MTWWSTRVLVAVLVTAPCARVAAQDPRVFAQQRYDRGYELYRARDWAGALAEFRASQALLASPGSRLFIARCLRELGRLDEAVAQYEATERDAAALAQTDPVRYARTAEVAREESAPLAPRVGRLTVAIANPVPGVRVRLGTRELPAEAIGLPIPVMPGTVHVRVESPGGRAPLERDAAVAAGASERVEVTLPPPPPPPPDRDRDGVPDALDACPRDAAPRARDGCPPVTYRRGPPPPAWQRGVGWTSLVAGVLGGAGFAAFGLLAAQQSATLVSMCGQVPCTSPMTMTTADDAIRAGELYQPLANIGLGVGIAGLVVGAVFLGLGYRPPPLVAVRPTARGAVPARAGAF